MFSKFKQRSYKLEHLDTGDYTADEYERCISELQIVNNWMGDRWSLEKTFLQDVESSNLNQFSVLDAGAGSGELLHVVAEWAKRNSKSSWAVGLELNERSAKAISERANERIYALRGNALSLPFADNSFDYAISSLFTHHLKNSEIVRTLQEMTRVARRRIFVIDLHRHPIAYLLYTTVAKIVLHTRLVREDGALSILRGFQPHELGELASAAGLSNVSVQRHFPFRLVLSASKPTMSTSGDSSVISFDHAA